MATEAQIKARRKYRATEQGAAAHKRAVAKYRKTEKYRLSKAKSRRHNVAKKKDEYRAYLGGACVVCGVTEKLDFDHINPNTKKFNITTYIELSFARIKEELDKCQLLCRKHHNEKTHGSKDKS